MCLRCETINPKSCLNRNGNLCRVTYFNCDVFHRFSSFSFYFFFYIRSYPKCFAHRESIFRVHFFSSSSVFLVVLSQNKTNNSSVWNVVMWCAVHSKQSTVFFFTFWRLIRWKLYRFAVVVVHILKSRFVFTVKHRSVLNHDENEFLSFISITEWRTFARGSRTISTSVHFLIWPRMQRRE